MTPLVLALALAGQYPTPQTVQYQYQAASTYSAPVYAAQPQVVMLGAGQVLQPGPVGMLLGHIGRKLEQHSWPRVQPATMMAQPAMQTIYLQVSQPQVQQAVYTLQMPTYQAPPQTYAAQPQLPAKGQPQTYGSPQQQAPQSQAPKPSESVPPVPQR